MSRRPTIQERLTEVHLLARVKWKAAPGFGCQREGDEWLLAFDDRLYELPQFE